MGRKKNRRKWDPDEIEFDLDKLSEYMKNLKPGQYADVDDMVAQCASTDLNLEKLSRYVSGIRPGEYLVFDNLVISCSEDGFDIQEIDVEGENDS